jgi:O-antigen ligase
VDVFSILFTLSAIPALWMGYNWVLGIPTLIALVGGCLVYGLVSRLAVKESWWRKIAAGIVVIGCLIAVYFITQAGRLEYDEKVGVIFRLSTWISAFFPTLSFWKPQPNSIGSFLEGLIFLCIPLSLGRLTAAEKWLWRGSFFIIALALLLSASRGAWLAVLTAGSLWIALHWRPLRWIMVLAAAAALGLGVWVLASGSLDGLNEIPLLSGVLNAFFNRPDRFEVIWNSLLLVSDYRFTGIGLGGQFGLVYSRFQLYMPHVFLTYAHNLFLQVWLEQGLLGITAWIGLVTATLIKLRLPAASPRRYQQQAAWVGLAAVLLHGSVDARMYVDLWCWLPFFVLVGLLAAVPAAEEQAEPVLLQNKWLPLGISLIFLFLIIAMKPAAAGNTNLGALYQLRADLAPGLRAEQKARYLQQANSSYRRALNLAPDQRGANYRLGLIALENLEFREAVGFLERARHPDTGHIGVDKALGLAYTFSGRITEGHPLLLNRIDIVNELNYWGWYFGTIGQQDASKYAYRQSLRIQPDQPNIRSLAD